LSHFYTSKISFFGDAGLKVKDLGLRFMSGSFDLPAFLGMQIVDNFLAI
jgi:hypothetical protein